MTLARKNSHLAQAIDVDYSAVGDSLTIPSSGNVTITNSLAISSQTVSTIVGFDENQKLISLPTSTYPSFTELSYLKGVTSSLQTQLNSKSPSASPSFTGSSTFTNSGDVVPLTVTNTGTAASFVVNDVSGDSTPFVVDASGNVGIGISPVFRLHIDGGSAALINSAADPLFYIGEGFGTAEYGFLKWDRTNNQMLIGTDASASVQIVTGNSPRLTISSAGTTTFTGQIVGQAGADISGTTALGDTINIGTASAGNTIVNVGIGATGDRFAITDYIGDTTYTDFGLRVGRANGGANGNSIIQHRGTGVLAVTAIDAGSMVFATSNSPRLTISSTGTATFAGQIVGQAGMDVSGAATFANSGNVVPMTVTNTGTANSFVVNDASGDTSPFVIDADGRVVVGGSSAQATADTFSLVGALQSSGSISRGVVVRALVPSSSTLVCNAFQSTANTEAATFTLDTFRHFVAGQLTFGAGSTVVDQFGFVALSSLTGATNNYGFYSDIPSGSGRWNFYANGTADNYFAGPTTITAPLTLTGTVAGNNRMLKFQTSGVNRWQITPSFDAESGSNAGSNFHITRWSDAGSFMGTPLYITRSTGVINCENGLKIVSGQLLVTAGSASAPGVAFGPSDTNTGMFSPGADQLAFSTNQATRMLIDAVGDVSMTQTYYNLFNELSTGAGWACGYNLDVDGSTVERRFTGAISAIVYASNSLRFFCSGSDSAGTAAAERMRIDASGRVQINRTSPINEEMLHVLQASVKPGVVIKSTATSGTAEPGVYIEKQDNNNTTAQKYILFAYNAGANGGGGIEGNGGTGAQFFASSDERLKENIADLAPQLANIMAMKPRVFDYISGPTGCTGFVAQELEEIYPDAVGVDANGYKTIGGISIMETRIISAIQELAARIAALEERLSNN